MIRDVFGHARSYCIAKVILLLVALLILFIIFVILYVLCSMYYVGLFCFCIVHVRAFVVLFDLRPVPSLHTK
jgi:hypothetical protein